MDSGWQDWWMDECVRRRMPPPNAQNCFAFARPDMEPCIFHVHRPMELSCSLCSLVFSVVSKGLTKVLIQLPEDGIWLVDHAKASGKTWENRAELGSPSWFCENGRPCWLLQFPAGHPPSTSAPAPNIPAMGVWTVQWHVAGCKYSFRRWRLKLDSRLKDSFHSKHWWFPNIPSSHLVDNAPANKKASERFPCKLQAIKTGTPLSFLYQKRRFIAKKACGRCMRMPCPAALSVHQERTPEVIRLIRPPTPWSMMACFVYLKVIDLWESCYGSPMNQLGERVAGHVFYYWCLVLICIYRILEAASWLWHSLHIDRMSYPNPKTPKRVLILDTTSTSQGVMHCKLLQMMEVLPAPLSNILIFLAILNARKENPGIC